MFALTAGMIAFGVEKLVLEAKKSFYGYPVPRILVIAPHPTHAKISEMIFGFSFGPEAHAKSVGFSKAYGEMAVRQGVEFLDCAPLQFELNEMDGLHYSVNFPYLQEQYPNVVAWLIQEGTDLNHPIMQAEDNDFYLERLYNNRNNKGGSLFLDSGNQKDFVDANSYIYGHNMKSGDMFTVLGNFRQHLFYEDHSTVYLYTPEKDFEIQLVAGYTLDSAVETPPLHFADEDSFDNYLNDVKRRSFFYSTVKLEYEDQIMYLATCTNRAQTERFVIVGKLVQTGGK